MHRDNHYVSRSYLKRWTSDGVNLWSYRVLVPHARVPLWRESSTKAVAYHEHLYTRAIASGDSDEIEQWLDREFEAPAEDAISKAVENRRLTPRDWTLLARFFAAQDVRTPARLMEQMKRWSATLPGQIESSLKERIAELESMTPEERADLAASTPKQSDTPFRVSVERRPGESGGWVKGETVSGRPLWLWSIRQLLTGQGLSTLCAHRWTILSPPPGVTWFTSDDPVLKVNFNSLSDYTFGGGWGSPGTDLFLPLGPQHLLYTQVGKSVPARGTVMSPERAEVVRRLIAEHAHRYVFANYPDSFVEAARPRTVDAAELDRERAEWERWHEEQSKAERNLWGWGTP